MHGLNKFFSNLKSISKSVTLFPSNFILFYWQNKCLEFKSLQVLKSIYLKFKYFVVVDYEKFWDWNSKIGSVLKWDVYVSGVEKNPLTLEQQEMSFN